MSLWLLQARLSGDARGITMCMSTDFQSMANKADEFATMALSHGRSSKYYVSNEKGTQLYRGVPTCVKKEFGDAKV